MLTLHVLCDTTPATYLVKRIQLFIGVKRLTEWKANQCDVTISVNNIYGEIQIRAPLTWVAFI